MNGTTGRRWRHGLWGLALAALVAGCATGGGGDDGGGGNESTQKIDVNVAGFVQAVPVTAGTDKDFSFTYTTPRVPGPMAFTALGVDVAATLGSASLRPKPVLFPKTLAAGSVPTQAHVTVRTAPAAEQSTVCDTGALQGEWDVDWDETSHTGQVTPADPITVPQETLRVLNLGAIAVCVRVTPSQDGILNLNQVSFNATTCDTGAALIAGDWTGTYTCRNYGPGETDSINEPITLTVEQDTLTPHSAHYFDSSATYDGSVCGGTFRFNGAGPGYTESGVFTLTDNDHAVKTSDWKGDGDFSGGHCEDHLTRVPG